LLAYKHDPRVAGSRAEHDLRRVLPQIARAALLRFFRCLVQGRGPRTVKWVGAHSGREDMQAERRASPHPVLPAPALRTAGLEWIQRAGDNCTVWAEHFPAPLHDDP